MRTIALRLLTAGLALAVASCVQAPNTVLKSYDISTGEPIPVGLRPPGAWVYLGQETKPPQVQTMRWVRPEGMAPRPALPPAQGGAQNGPDPATQLRKPMAAPGAWTASYEFQVMPRPPQPGQEYFASFREAMLAECPSADIRPLQLDSVDIVIEAHARGCARFGQQSQIDRFLFGAKNLYHIVYVIHAGTFTREQHAEALDALRAWSFKE